MRPVAEIMLMDSYYPGWLVFVDDGGHRFVNEQAAYSVVESTFQARDGRAWATFDDAAKRAAVPRSTAAAKKYDMPTGSNWEDWVEPVIDEMAAKGIVLVAGTVRELAESVGLPPRARRRARPVQRGCPRGRGHAVRQVARGDAHGRGTPVLRDADEAVQRQPDRLWPARGCRQPGPRRGQPGDPGAVCRGECAGGVLGDVYMGSGNALANAVTFGRIAGTSAAARALVTR